MERLGLSIGFQQGSLRDELAICREAEDLGYTDVWSAEVAGPDGLSPLAALAVTSSELRLGTAILPVFTRPPALMAMSAMALQQLSGGRFVLGLGTSSSIIVERWMGGSFEAPLVRLREYVEVIRRALAGEKVTYDGRTVAVRSFRLERLPPQPVPIYIAALGPHACRLAGEIADGVIFFLKTPDGVRQALGWVAEGARKAGRDPESIDCIIRLPVLMGPDESALEGIGRFMVVTYAMVDVYNRSLVAQGFESEARAIAKAWADGDRDGATKQVTGEMVRSLLVLGDADDCTARLKQFREAGTRTPVILPVSIDSDPAAGAAHVRSVVAALSPQ